MGLMILIAVILGIGRCNLGWSNEFLKWVTYISPFYRVGDFIIGLVAGYIFVSRREEKSKTVYSVLEIEVAILIILQVIIYDRGVIQAANWMFSLFWLPTSVMFIYLSAVNKGILSRFLSKSDILVWIGNISADAFLIHHICIKAAEMMTEDKIFVAIIGLLLTMGCTMIWRWTYRKATTILMYKKGRIERNF